MAIDYTKLAATVERLLSDKGRAITLVRLDKTPADSNRPWLGNSTSRSGATTVPATGVFVPIASLQELGLWTKDQDGAFHSEEVALVSAQEVSSELVETMQEIIDGTTRWKIAKVHTLQPGSVRLLYFIEVTK